jgi:hypothetical protein
MLVEVVDELLVIVEFPEIVKLPEMVELLACVLLPLADAVGAGVIVNTKVCVTELSCLFGPRHVMSIRRT